MLSYQYVGDAFLDISGAFDNLKLCQAVRSMRTKAVSNCITNWYSDYQYNWKIRADIKGKSSQATIHKGTPKGGGEF